MSQRGGYAVSLTLILSFAIVLAGGLVGRQRSTGIVPVPPTPTTQAPTSPVVTISLAGIPGDTEELEPFPGMKIEISRGKPGQLCLTPSADWVLAARQDGWTPHGLAYCHAIGKADPLTIRLEKSP